MDQSPDIFTASEIIGRTGKLAAARPFCFRTLTFREIIRRAQLAMGVFSGRYDVLKWD